MDDKTLFKKALKEDKLVDFIVGRGDFKYSIELTNYGGDVRHTYYDKFGGDISKALKERYERAAAASTYFGFYEEELPEGIGKRRGLIRQLLDEEGQFAWDVVHRLNTLRGGTAFSNRDFLLVALEKNEVRDYILAKNRFCDWQGHGYDPEYNRAEELVKYYRSLPEGADRQKLRDYVVEALRPDAPEKFLSHIFKPLLEVDPKLKKKVNSGKV
ncbi:MAG: hypothetical protein JW778_04690 [Candidatus Altiarchaeota archaeon]|nr:hypothetical protein [Candidatus Altiarchaeota archaeon]